MNIAIIPARGGSVRLERKNIKPFFGKPIIAYSIQTAQASGVFEHIVVSTDSRQIADVAKAYGAEVLKRPGDMSEQNGAPDPGTQEVTRFVLMQLIDGGILKPETIVCCIYPTAPLMSDADLRNGLVSLLSHKAPFVFSTDPDGVDAGQWYWGRAESFIERRSLVEGIRYVLPRDRVCDINTLSDWSKAEVMYCRKHHDFEFVRPYPQLPEEVHMVCKVCKRVEPT